MNQSLWNTDDAVRLLSARSDLEFWSLERESLRRAERYLLTDPELSIDQDREVSTTEFKLWLGRRKGQTLGEARASLRRDLPLDPQIQSLFKSSLLTDHALWSLPPTPQKPSRLTQLTDPIWKDSPLRGVESLTQDLREAILAHQDVRFHSAEIVVAAIDRELVLSSGARSIWSETHAYAEVAVSPLAHDGREVHEEHLETCWALCSDDLKIGELMNRAAECAKTALTLTPPPTGRVTVLLDAKSLAQIIQFWTTQMSAQSKYLGLPFRSPGSDWVPEPSADLLSLTLDPTQDFCFGSLLLCPDSSVPQVTPLIESNRIVATLTDTKYGQSLGASQYPATTTSGTWVLKPGSKSVSDLRLSQQQVLEVLEFSALSVDAETETFSSEIRLARLWDRSTGTSRGIKGGTLSGSLVESFRSLCLSSEIKRHHMLECYAAGRAPTGYSYIGPSHVLLDHVQVSR